MRAAEWINLFFFSFLVALAWLQGLARHRCLKATAIGAVAIFLILGAQFLQLLLPRLQVSVTHDWFPAPLLLLAYWQAGQFLTKPNEAFQAKLLKSDVKLLKVESESRSALKLPPWLATYFEFAYLFCYGLVPFGLGVLYMMRMGRYADRFWAAVLPSAYLCYLMLPFVQTLPPRIQEGERAPGVAPGKVRGLNLWILRHAGIQANTFPSAHAAATVAASFVLLRLVPWAGLVFLGMAVSIAAGGSWGSVPLPSGRYSGRRPCNHCLPAGGPVFEIRGDPECLS